MKRKIKHLLGGIKGAFVVLFAFMLFPFARLFLWRRKIWLVSEHGYEARDNGYIFFKYMRENRKDVNCYYAIDFRSSDYPKIKDLGHAIKFGSFKHFAYFCAARYIVSSKNQGFCPSYYLTLLRKRVHLWSKYIFLQHGITKDDQKFLYKKAAKIDLFICGAKPEYEDIKSHYGYMEKEVAYTGFARFDSYFNLTPKNQILVMPTWRRYTEKIEFTETDYYKTWSAFINSTTINEILIKHGINMYFYLHPQYKEYSHLFSTNCSNVKVLPFEGCDFQALIRDSKMFITDFSSLAFDFGYMKRSVIYYQYDEKEYFEKHYIKGYFDYRRDGFGPVCNELEDVINTLTNAIERNFVTTEKEQMNQEIFFPLYDSKNCERIYSQIKLLRKNSKKHLHDSSLI